MTNAIWSKSPSDSGPSRHGAGEELPAPVAGYRAPTFRTYSFAETKERESMQPSSEPEKK